MNGFIKLLLVIVVLAIGYKVKYPTYTLRHRLTIEVETPQGLRSASSIIEVSAILQPIYNGFVRIKGDAVFVDLGQGKHVIALLTNGPKGDDVDGPNYWVIEALGLPSPDRPMGQYLDATNRVGQRGDLPPAHIPTLVTFGDLADPKTARGVAPYAFEQEFGAGYVFRRAWIEMVPVGIWPLNNLGIYGTPITRGIEKRLPEAMAKLKAELNNILGRAPGDPFKILYSHLHIQ